MIKLHSPKLHISAGTSARLLKDKSSFSSSLILGWQICFGIEDKEFPCTFSCFIVVGSDGNGWFDGFSNLFLPNESVVNFGRLDNGTNSWLVKAFSSQLNDFRSFSCEILPRLVNLFFERSSVLRDVHLTNNAIDSLAAKLYMMIIQCADKKCK